MYDREKIQRETDEIIRRTSETAPGNYTEMQGLIDAVSVISVNSELIKGVVGLMQSNVDNMTNIIKTLDFCYKEIDHLYEHVKELYKIIHELAPDYEIIETMAESADERHAMCNAYMNHAEWTNSGGETEHEKSRK